MERLRHLDQPMSLKDQKFAYHAIMLIMVSTLVVSYPISYVMENIFIAVIAVSVSALFAIVLFGPNWLQRPDEELVWVDQRTAYDYYQQYKLKKEQISESSENDVTYPRARGKSKKQTAANASSSTKKQPENAPWATSLLKKVKLL